MSISSQDIDAYVRSARQSPRLTDMFDAFSNLATGTQGRPDVLATLSPNLLQHDALCLRYAEMRSRHVGTFNQHFVASLPYVLEEQCRFGAGVVAYSRCLMEKVNRPMDVYTLGDAAGVTARTLTEITSGHIRTLTCSPNP